MRPAAPDKLYPVRFSAAWFSSKHLKARVDLSAAGSPAVAAVVSADLVDRIERTGVLKSLLDNRNNLAQLTARNKAGNRMEIDLSFEPTVPLARLAVGDRIKIGLGLDRVLSEGPFVLVPWNLLDWVAFSGDPAHSSRLNSAVWRFSTPVLRAEFIDLAARVLIDSGSLQRPGSAFRIRPGLRRLLIEAGVIA